MSCNSSTTNSVLNNDNFSTLDVTCAVLATTNRAYSDDPMQIAEAYTYYWELTKKPPDNTSAPPAILGIMGYTILVVYVTWKFCSQQRKQSSCLTQQQHLASLPPYSHDVVDSSRFCHTGSTPFAITNYGTGITPSVQKDGLFVFGKATDTTAFVVPTTYHPLRSKSSSALDLKGSPMKFQLQRARHTLNGALFYDPEEFKGMTVGDVKTALAASLSNKWRCTNNDGTGITPAVQKDGLFVFEKPTGSITFEAPPSLSPLGPIPLIKPAIQFPMKSASISTFSVMPETGLSTPTYSLLAWPTAPTDTDTSSKSSPAPDFKLSAAVKFQQQRVRHEAKNMLPANILIESLRNNHCPDECTKKEWNLFVNKHWTSLLNQHLQNRPKRLYCAKILTPHERGLLLEADVPMLDLSTITQQTLCIAKMKCALKAGVRQCSYHHQSRFQKSARHHKPISPIPKTTIHCYMSSRSHCLKQRIQPHHTWRRRKRERTDSEAVTNGSNKRLRKPD